MPLEVVQLDNGALLARKIFDRLNELGTDLARFDFAHHVVGVVAQRIDERNLVALFVREKLFERKHRGAADALRELIEFFARDTEARRDFVGGWGATKFDFELLLRPLEFAGTLTNCARNPIEGAQGVENRPVDAGYCVGFKLDSACVIIFFDGVDQT